MIESSAGVRIDSHESRRRSVVAVVVVVVTEEG